jgi:precorrin-4/cobalt-precorrin-4 C11-methyltransferase
MISFVGAGPGAPDLITLRGASRLSMADIVIWASSLVPESLLVHANRDSERFDSAGMTLEDVLTVFEAHPDAAIVRLHSGDPSIYGALQEQVDWCVENERDFEIVPGVSSLAAAAATLERELTIPGITQSVVVTRLAARTASSMPPRESIARFAATGCTIAVFLSAARPVALQEALLEPPSAFTAETPVAIVIRASWPDQRVVRTTLGDLSDQLHSLGTTTTVLVLVGDALDSRGLRSRLYSPAFAHSRRKRSVPGESRGRPAAS